MVGLLLIIIIIITFFIQQKEKNLQSFLPEQTQRQPSSQVSVCRFTPPLICFTCCRFSLLLSACCQSLHYSYSPTLQTHFSACGISVSVCFCLSALSGSVPASDLTCSPGTGTLHTSAKYQILLGLLIQLKQQYILHSDCCFNKTKTA